MTTKTFIQCLQAIEQLVKHAPTPLKVVRVAGETLQATDGETSVLARIPGVRAETPTLIETQALLKAVRATQNIPLSFTAERAWCTVNGITLTAAPFDDNNYPTVLNEDDFNSITDLPVPLPSKEDVRWVLTAASKDVSRPALCSVFFDAQHGTLVASDGYRLHCVETQTTWGGDDPLLSGVLLPRAAVECLLQHWRQPTCEWRCANNDTAQRVAVLRSSCLTLIIIPQHQKFPTYRDIWPKTSAATWTAPVKPLSDILRQCQALSTKKRQATVQISPHAEGAHVFSEVSEVGRIAAVAPGLGGTIAETFLISPTYLLEALSGFSDTCTLDMTDNKHPIVWKDGTRAALIMPIRFVPFAQYADDADGAYEDSEEDHVA